LFSYRNNYLIVIHRLIHTAVIFLLIACCGTAAAQGIILKEPVRYLALGDSYTIGESVGVTERWPVQLINSLVEMGLEADPATIIARTGWRTDNLEKAIADRDLQEEFTLVSLLIGVNDQYQGYDVNWYRQRFEALLKSALSYAGGDRSAVFVLSIPDYAYTPFGQSLNPDKISKELDAFNEINDSISAAYGITYADITPVSRRGLENPELVASDGLHPSGKMYEEWVKLILELITVERSTSSTDLQEQTSPGTVHPNPASDSIEFRLQKAKPGKVEIRIYNSLGNLISTIKTEHQTSVRFDTSLLKPGIYYYNMQSPSGEIERGSFIIV
jgi:lysophospholipase L1-like esterase